MARTRLTEPNFDLFKRNGRYYIRWWDGTRTRRISTGTSDLREAKRQLVQHEAGALEPAQPRPYVSEILDAYLADRQGRVEAYAALHYACLSLKRHLGDLHANHITRERTRRYAAQRRKDGKKVGNPPRPAPISNGTIIRELVTLRAALRQAGHHDAALRVETPQAPAPRDRWLTRPEAEKLLAAAKSHHVWVFILLALYTGARTGAILTLTWRQVDLTRGLIDYGAGHGNKRRGATPIPGPLLAALREARPAATQDRVIEARGRPVSSIKKGVMAAARRAKLTGVTPHVLRHTCATWLAIGGRPMSEIARYLSISEGVAERVYAKHSPDYLQSSVRVLEGK